MGADYYEVGVETARCRRVIRGEDPRGIRSGSMFPKRMGINLSLASLRVDHSGCVLKNAAMVKR